MHSRKDNNRAPIHSSRGQGALWISRTSPEGRANIEEDQLQRFRGSFLKNPEPTHRIPGCGTISYRVGGRPRGHPDWRATWTSSNEVIALCGRHERGALGQDAGVCVCMCVNIYRSIYILIVCASVSCT